MHKFKYKSLPRKRRKKLIKKSRKIKINYILYTFAIIISICTLYYYGKNIFKFKKNVLKPEKFLVENVDRENKAKIGFNIVKKHRTDNKWFPGNVTEILDNYFKNYIPNCSESKKNDFIEKFKIIDSLKVYSDDDENSIKLLKDKFNKKFNKNVSLVQNIFITKGGNFGNQICCLNNIIFYSEILGIKNIYLNPNIDYLYLKNKVTTDKINIELKSRDQINCQSEDTICAHVYFDFFFPFVFKPTARAIILKDEIKRNLPKVNIDKNDLYIHIRAGNIFEGAGGLYSPPPYCFYQKVLKNFKFNKVYLISIDDKSPVIGKLLSNYPNIIHEFHSVAEDTATLINAYNLVNSISSFSQVAIFFNDNINNLWEYDIYKLQEKIWHYHHDIQKLNREFNIYRMKPSENYVKEMFDWRIEENQKKIMLEEVCNNDFVLTKSTDTLF